MPRGSSLARAGSAGAIWVLSRFLGRYRDYISCGRDQTSPAEEGNPFVGLQSWGSPGLPPTRAVSPAAGFCRRARESAGSRMEMQGAPRWLEDEVAQKCVYFPQWCGMNYTREICSRSSFRYINKWRRVPKCPGFPPRGELGSGRRQDATWQMPSALSFDGAEEKPSRTAAGQKTPRLLVKNSSMLGQEGGLERWCAARLPTTVLGPLPARGPMGTRAPSASLGGKGAVVSCSVRGLAASCAQRGTVGGARCCWGFLEGLGRMLMVAGVALQRTR